MEQRHSSPQARPRTQRERSNSLPIVEALGCSTPEAKLLLAEGRAAVRTRRARSQRERPADIITTFNPRDHLGFLNGPPPAQQFEQQITPSETRSCHARIPSTSTDCSTSTLVPQIVTSEPHENSSTSPLGTYSANLAKFIKAQLKNIPTYASTSGPPSPLSPRSCPDLSFRARTPSQSPNPILLRSVDAPRIIEIPPIRPPVRSQFSAWSSTDDEMDDEVDEDLSPLPEAEPRRNNKMMDNYKRSPSILGHYGKSGGSSFLLSSTPFEEESQSETETGYFFDVKSTDSRLSPMDVSPLYFADDYPSSNLSRPQLASDISSISTSSYFDLNRPFAITPQMRDRIIAAVTPPVKNGKTITAISPWEGAALSNVHDVVVESQHRVRIDGLSFDMQRDFVLPSRIGTPC